LLVFGDTFRIEAPTMRAYLLREATYKVRHIGSHFLAVALRSQVRQQILGSFALGYLILLTQQFEQGVTRPVGRIQRLIKCLVRRHDLQWLPSIRRQPGRKARPIKHLSHITIYAIRILLVLPECAAVEDLLDDSRCDQIDVRAKVGNDDALGFVLNVVSSRGQRKNLSLSV
jgi:hypothetical protein